MKITTWICGLLLSVAASTPALAWEYQGHQMVGAIADQILVGDAYANARQKVKEILGFTLQEAAPWPDCVRSVVHKDDGSFSYLPSPLHPSYRIPCKPFETQVGSPEPSQPSAEQRRMEDYAKRNWYNCTYIISARGTPGGCHQAFHFADVAIQRDSYDRRYVGTGDHDIVSAINACIAVLQDRPVPSPFFIKDKKEALFLLAHFVGDIHQPLHVGAVYLDSKGERVNPDGTGLDPDTETHGGNSIDIEVGKPNLHAEWDGIPEDWGVTPDVAMLDEAKRTPFTPGSIKDWAAIWASETLKQAQAAFKDLTFSLVPKDPKFPDALPRWIVHFPDKEAYDRDAKKTKRTQLAKGGARLAQLLKAIWP
jgi:hypothetical protein